MASNGDEKKKYYEVGYGRPPRSGQFKPGKSGNPKGRPKLIQDFTTDFQNELEEIISVQKEGKSRPVTKQRALCTIIITGALKGNASYIKLAVALINKMPLKISDLEQDLSAEDAQILQQYIERKTKNDQQF